MEKKFLPVLRLFGTISGVTLLVSLIVLGVGLVFQWNTPVQFSNGFFAAGAIVIILGTFSVTGGFQQRASFPITYAETAGHASIAERGQRMLADINQRYGAMVLMIGTGLVLIGIAIAIPRLF
jgi:hypothetical protein